MIHHNKYPFLILLLLLNMVLFSCKQKTTDQQIQHEHEEVVYTCTMHPEIIRNAPGNCPICGMSLVKKTATEPQVAGIDLNTLLQPSNEFVVSSIPVTKIEITRQPVEINAFGFVSYNTRHAGIISAKYTGRIEKLFIRYRFQKVFKGQRIMDIYSPELMTAQQNLLFLLKNDAANTPLISASKQRLLFLGMTSGQIDGIIKAGQPLLAVPVYSAYSGQIHEAAKNNSMPGTQQASMPDIPLITEELSLRPGMYIQKGQPLFSVYNPDKVWATLNIYEDIHMLVKKGDVVTIVPETAPEKKFRGHIDFIEPFFREGSKTITARVYFDNSSLRLPVGSQVKGIISSLLAVSSWLPASAVVSLGSDKIVFIKQHGGFKAKKLLTGISYNNKIQVVSGLNGNDSVAENARFLMDSESFIKVNQ